MTEIEKAEQATMSLAQTLPVGMTGGPTASTLDKFMEWGRAFDSAVKIGTALCRSPFVPAAFQGKPEATAIAIMEGAALGIFNPIAAVRMFHVVNGRAGLYARSMVGLVQKHGGDVQVVEESPEAVTVQARRRRTDEWQEFSFTMAEAKQAGYTSNKKYQSDPQGMLYAKAATKACRRVAADIVEGLVSAEELDLGDYDDACEVESKPARKPRASRRKITTAKTTSMSTAKPDPDPEEAAVAEPAKATAAQLSRIAEKFKSMGITDRAQILDNVAEIAGRDLTSSSDLTEDEAAQVIAELEAGEEA